MGYYFFAPAICPPRLYFSPDIPAAREANDLPPHDGGSTKSGGADMRVKVTLACTECKQRNYVSKKNKKNDPDRIEMMKHCKFCRKHTLHKETK
jgi:large subunit ribosomal protein L33